MYNRYMRPFDHSSYRAYLLELCDHPEARGLRKQLSAAAGCQPSYLSQALHGRVHLTEEHLAGIAGFLRLKAEEAEYLLLLLRAEKAGNKVLRDMLEAQKAKLLAKQKNLKNRVGAGAAPMSEADIGLYFSTWIPSAVHLLTSDPAYGHAEKIAERLRLPAAKITETLRFLEKLGLVAHGKKGWAFARSGFHLPKDSPWQSAFQASRRELAARSIALNPRGATHFSTMFTISPEDLRKLEQLTADFVSSAHQRIHASGTESLAAICIDLFEIV